MNKHTVKLSKYLSFVLRHNPGSIGLTLDSNGWVAVDELIRAAENNNRTISRVLIEEVVATNDKRQTTNNAFL